MALNDEDRALVAELDELEAKLEAARDRAGRPEVLEVLVFGEPGAVRRACDRALGIDEMGEPG